ncbi:MAG: Holliday junction branch migration protein RuvA [Holosporaceae bacterium]|jgi:Holliday junction DNA helicase RuvA|nr:Holliday junction branch migration protein RuvA [Holosporaceae bacterium]
MIAHLEGKVVKIGENSMIVDVNGVGYSVICSAKTIGEAQSRLEAIHLFTTLSVREDAWTLYGFISEQERLWFNTLISVQGVGGKVAVAILSALSDEDIYNAFLSGDKNMFTRADGVGPKLAARIITELKDKVVGKIELNVAAATAEISGSSVLNDVISALSNLGYSRSDILRAVSSMRTDSEDGFDVLLKKVLGKLSSGV